MDFEDDVDTIAILSIGSGGGRAEVRAFLNDYAHVDGDDIVIDHLSTIRIKNFTDIEALINDIDCCSLA
ncbi:hypothetical protein [Neptunicoccus cionae]|uniref:hypothetical protein n=1 Tax=Neptunicoccus cionae TaxID=2035344 RepID=UPI000C76ADE0|nr:hypothetical protein [Amylibacter cionae]PLS23275.1 hypothetical protein C0U40_03860 [Amylibacter cionae]